MTNISTAHYTYKHAEAFCLMNYRCDECGHHEVLWNSRDGVTPFCIECRKCKDPMGMTHVDFHLDRRLPFHVLMPGERYFADLTRERSRELANRNADKLVSLGRITENQRNSTANKLFDSYFGNGNNPDILELKP